MIPIKKMNMSLICSCLSPPILMGLTVILEGENTCAFINLGHDLVCGTLLFNCMFLRCADDGGYLEEVLVCGRVKVLGARQSLRE